MQTKKKSVVIMTAKPAAYFFVFIFCLVIGTALAYHGAEKDFIDSDVVIVFAYNNVKQQERYLTAMKKNEPSKMKIEKRAFHMANPLEKSSFRKDFSGYEGKFPVIFLARKGNSEILMSRLFRTEKDVQKILVKALNLSEGRSGKAAAKSRVPAERQGKIKASGGN